MDKNIFEVQKKQIERTVKALEASNMQAFYAPDRNCAIEKLKSLLPQNATVACGGSMTLNELGVTALLKNGEYNYLDRNREGITPDEIAAVYRNAFSADVYISSSNAITEAGELVNADGNSNRVAAITFGPASVIIIAGVNKITANLDEAVKRIKATAAPANVGRLSCKTPCAQTGKCEGCRSSGCICCTWTIHRFSRIPGRIKVILINDTLGY